MKLLKPAKEVVIYGLRAMKMVAEAAEGGMQDAHKTLINAAQHTLLDTDYDIDELERITAEELAKHFTDKAISRQFVQGLILVSIVNSEPTVEQSKLISQFGEALGVDEKGIKVIHELANHEMMMFKMDFFRNSHVADYLKNTYKKEGGLLGFAKAWLSFKGYTEDTEVADKFHALKDLPKDTLGYAIHEFYQSKGFNFPGEKHGFPIGAVYHDVGHILAENGTNRDGEMLQGAFQAGYRRTDNAFFTLLFVVFLHSSGVEMPIVGLEPKHGRLGREGMAEKMFKELERGSKMNVDLGGDWDLWAYVGKPLDQVREELNILPKVGY